MASKGMTAWAVVVAAGSGRRMGGPVAKQFLLLRGEPVLAHTLRALEAWPGLKGTVVVAPADQLGEVVALAKAAGLKKFLRAVPGGAERRDSVRAGLEALTEAASSDVVFLHDGVRPFPPVERFDDLARAAAPDGALFAVPLKDTVKRAMDGCSVETPDRASLRLAQTPQAFVLERILAAHRQAAAQNLPVTDDASLIERLGGRPRLLEGCSQNLKITTPEDLVMAEAVLGRNEPPRVGYGYDVHRLVPGRRLILGGVDIPHESGLLGHSDADVLAHAVTDACLGAAGLGDIGTHFPDTDPQWKGADSLVLLATVRERLAEAGFSILHVDATVVAQRPKVAPHVAQMRQRLARALQVPDECVNVKGKTTEGLGFAGREEGIAAHAVATLVRR